MGNKMYDLIVIGAGSGGLVAAATAVGMGAKVMLVERRKMGGDCLNYGCVPSKTFLKSAHLAHKIKNSAKYGIEIGDINISLEKIMQRVRDVITEIAPHDSRERFEGMGVDVVLGHAKITARDTVTVDGSSYTTRRILISTGSTASVPNISGLSDVPYYTNESIFELKTLPKRLIVLGGGPIGLELGQGFAHLGSQVHIIERNSRLFTKDEPEVSDIMHQQFIDDGMSLHTGSEIIKAEKRGDEVVITIKQGDTTSEVVGDILLVALGRIANTKDMGLTDIGVARDARGFIIVNEKLQTTVHNIYACGDVKGKYLFTHTASYEATIAVKNALLTPVFETDYHNIAWTTYTVPEVARVGLSEKEATEKGELGSARIIAIDKNDRAKAEDDRYGFVKIILDSKHHVLGATIVGEKAGEMLPILSLMVTKKMKIGDAMGIIYQYPIQGEIVKSIALDDFKANVQAWQRTLVQKIVSK